MDLKQISLFSALQNKMVYLGERQAVIAQNIANANTPNYQPMDLKKVTFSQLVNNQAGGLQPAITQSGHMTTSMSGSSRFQQASSGTNFDTTPAGNSVILEEQILKMNQTAHDYQATTMLYKKMTSLMKVAIGDNQ